MNIIGITGPTGSGKTTALNVLSDFGALIIDCDKVYHDLLTSSDELKKELAEQFGDVIENGAVNRKKLGAIVFNDAQALDALNAITLRYMDSAVKNLIREHGEHGGELAAIDAIALIESGIGRQCDLIVGIIAPKEVRARRIMAREGISMEYAISRIEAQQQDGFYRSNCGAILENNGTMEEFETKCRKFFSEYLKKEL